MSTGEIEDLKKASDGAVTLSRCDIADEGAVKTWAAEVVNRNDGRIDSHNNRTAG